MKKLISALVALVILSLAVGCGGTAIPPPISAIEPSPSPTVTPTEPTTPPVSTITPSPSPTQTPKEPAYPWPTTGWQTSTPEKQGMDSKKLDEMMISITEQNLAIDSVLTVRHGYIVFEKYPGLLDDKDIIHPIYSCTKSVMGALIGIAVKEGFIDSLQHKVLDYFSDRTIQNLDSRKKSITLEHLLAMTGGMEWDEWRYPYTDPRNDWIKALYSSDTVQYVLDLPMASDPGVIWNYNGGYSYLLSAILTKTTKDNTLDFARKYLFDPLGISELNWNRDRNGIYDGAGGLSLTPRDMAKFGLLYLHNGKWDGKQIVPADFLAESVKTHHFFSASSGYGYESWWTYPLDEFYYAAGIYGQRIYVVPDRDLVIVFTASIYGPDPESQLRPLVTRYVMAACK